MNRPFERTPEDEAKAAARRLKREQAIRRERAEPVANHLRMQRNCGVVALEGVSIDYMLEGLEDRVGEGRVLRLDAFGTIQGADMGYEHAEHVLKLISYLRREHGGRSVVAFLGFNYGDTRSLGTPLVSQNIMDRLRVQSEVKPWQSKEPAVLVVGDGHPADLPSHELYRHKVQHPLAAMLQARLALGRDNELSTMLTTPEGEGKVVEGGTIYLPPVPPMPKSP